MPERELSPFDRVLAGLNNALRTVAAPAGKPSRPNPARHIEDAELEDHERRHAAGLMRVNHAGEIAAQGLYQGHALVARAANVGEQLEKSAAEEFDHLAWCEQRLAELDSGPSRLSALWYVGSVFIGAASGLLGDRWSLGFIAETESQVCEHLEAHMDRLPDKDRKSRAIVSRMHEEEAEHGRDAVAAGALELPDFVRRLMKLTARVMTTTAYRV